MKSTKTMILGVLIVLVGLSLATGLAQLAALQIHLSVDVMNALPLVAFTVVLAGLLIGVVGFFQRN